MAHPPSMALAKDPLPHGSYISSKLQASPFCEEEDSSESSNGVSKTSAGAMTLSSCLTAPCSVDGKGYISKGSNYQPEETKSLFSSKTGCHAYDSVLHNSDSLTFSFQQSSLIDSISNCLKINSQKDNHCIWGNGLNSDYQWTQVSPKYARMQQDFSCFQTASSYCSIGYKAKESQPDEWLYSESAIIADTQHELEAHEPTLHKRPSMEESMQAQKKQCSSHPSKKQKPKSTQSKDPQSIAAKNRRERISERLKTLQELVPNGSKVDLVTMLEKAVSYVKFLQLQVKVLATHEFWPAQAGKAPDISQVKEAIDGILASHNKDDRNF